MDKGTSTSATSSDRAENSKPAREGNHLSAIDRYFHVTKCGSTTVTEIRGGVAALFTMAYIILLNPLILGNIEDVNGNSLEIPQVAAVTTLVAGVMTIAFGLLARYPFGIATDLGINTLVTMTFVANEGLAWGEAMGLVVLDGATIVLLVLTRFCTTVFHAIPSDMKAATGVGIGLSIAMIDLVDGGLVHRVPNAADTTTSVQLDIDGQIVSWPTAVFVLRLIICGIIVVRNILDGLFIGIVLNTIIALAIEALTDAGPSFTDGKPVPTGWDLAISALSDHVGGVPGLSLVGAVDLFGSFARVGALSATILLFTLALTNFFDTMGTITGLGRQAIPVNKDGMLSDMEHALVAEGIGTIVGGIVSSSLNTVLVDSAAGIANGTRTGLASIVTGILFLAAMLFAPFYEIVPIEAAAPVLVIVDVMMIGQTIEISLTRLDIALPAFLTMVIMLFTYSVTNGIGIGFITFAAMTIFSGHAKSVHLLMWIVSGLFIICFATGPSTALLGS